MESTNHSNHGILAIWNDCDPARAKEYEEWYRGEHLLERVGIPGFRSGWRYRAVDAEPEYFTYYETDSSAVMASPAYNERLNNPTALTTKIMSSGIFLNATRAVCVCTARWGKMRGGYAVSVRFDAQQGSSLQAAVREVARRPDVLRAEVGSP